MPTLQELLGDFGVSETVKTASETGSDEIEKLAAQYGFDFGKTASEDGDKDDEKGEKGKEKEEGEKEASVSLDAYFNSLFPEDDMLSKTAEEQEKIAAEENLGARAYDHFVSRFDRRIEKLASDMLTGGATISAPTGADHEGHVTMDPTIPQQNKTNRPANAGEKIETAPSITDEVSGKNDEKTVGHVQQKQAALANLAMRKALILSQLED